MDQGILMEFADHHREFAAHQFSRMGLGCCSLDFYCVHTSQKKGGIYHSGASPEVMAMQYVFE